MFKYNGWLLHADMHIGDTNENPLQQISTVLDGDAVQKAMD